MFDRFTDLERLRELGDALYFAVALASMVEYLFPPFPGDTIVLASAFLAAALSLSLPGIWFATTIGSMLGGVLAWHVGRVIGADSEKWPRWLRKPRIVRGVAHVDRIFQKHGPILLLSNRFVPVSRAFFFLGAGVAKLRLWQVLFWGGLSAALWNAMLIAIAALLGKNWQEIISFFKQYAFYSILVLSIVAIFSLAFWWWRKRR